jgi:hypothetical protein
MALRISSGRRATLSNTLDGSSMPIVVQYPRSVNAAWRASSASDTESILFVLPIPRPSENFQNPFHPCAHSLRQFASPPPPFAPFFARMGKLCRKHRCVNATREHPGCCPWSINIKLLWARRLFPLLSFIMAPPILDFWYRFNTPALTSRAWTALMAFHLHSFHHTLSNGRGSMQSYGLVWLLGKAGAALPPPLSPFRRRGALMFAPLLSLHASVKTLPYDCILLLSCLSNGTRSHQHVQPFFSLGGGFRRGVRPVRLMSFCLVRHPPSSSAKRNRLVFFFLGGRLLGPAGCRNADGLPLGPGCRSADGLTGSRRVLSSFEDVSGEGGLGGTSSSSSWGSCVCG